MGNAQHSAESGEWYTPPEWVETVRSALGGIAFDPCSSRKANDEVVKAGIWSNHGLDLDWSFHFKTIFVNPPGSCVKPGPHTRFSVCNNVTRCSCKLPKKFMERSIEAAAKGSNVIYLAYSVNQLRQLANLEVPSKVNVTIALPQERIAYLNPETLEPKRGTNCDSAFIHLSANPLHSRYFEAQFRLKGCLVLRRP